MRLKCAILSSLAGREYRSAQFLLMERFLLVPVFVPIITREIFMRMILWKYGIIDSNLTVTENG